MGPGKELPSSTPVTTDAFGIFLEFQDDFNLTNKKKFRVWGSTP